MLRGIQNLQEDAISTDLNLKISHLVLLLNQQELTVLDSQKNRPH